MTTNYSVDYYGLSDAKIIQTNQLRKFFFFHLGTWPIFIWEPGTISFGNLADFCLGTWQKPVRRVGGVLLGELAIFSKQKRIIRHSIKLLYFCLLKKSSS